MSKIVDQAGLAEALDQITESSVYFATTEGIITPNTRCYTKQEVEDKLQVLQDKKLNKAEYDKTLEEVIRVTGYKDIEEFSETKTYYQGDLVKRKEIDSKGNVVWVYYRYTKIHNPSVFITSDCVQSNLYSEIQSLKLTDVETVYLHISTQKGGIVLSDYQVLYNYDDRTYTATISENGEVEFSIPKGKEYTIIFPHFEGYADIPNMKLYASINIKSIPIQYTKEVEEREEVVIKGAVYTSSYAVADAESQQYVKDNAKFSIRINGKTLGPQKFNDNFLIYFYVPSGSTYQVICSNVSGYIHSNTTVSKVAGQGSQSYTFEFIDLATSTGSAWMAISSKGRLYSLDAISNFSDTELQALDIVALRLSNSVLRQHNAEFWIPLTYQYAGTWRLVTSYNSCQWYYKNVQLDTSVLPNCDTTYTLLAGYYPSIQGQENTDRLRWLALTSSYSTTSYWKNFTKIIRTTETEDSFPEAIVSQQCGDNAYWVVRDNSLYILGSGQLYDTYDSFEGTPWATYKGNISGIYISSGITSIGSHCFEGFATGETVEFTKIVCFATTPPTLTETSFSAYTVTLYVPSESFVTQNSSMISICDKCSLPIDGYECTPFIGAINQYAQLQLNLNRAVFQNFYLKWYKAKYGVDGSISYPNSGRFWSSSQSNATNAWILRNGSADGGHKAGSDNVVPFFALSPQAVANS